MDGVTEVINAAFSPSQHNRLCVVRGETPRFRVDTDKVQCLPHLLDELIDVKPLFRRYWHRVRDFISVILRVKRPSGACCAAQLTEDQVPQSKWHQSKVSSVEIWHNPECAFADLVQDLNSSEIRERSLQENKDNLRIMLGCTL